MSGEMKRISIVFVVVGIALFVVYSGGMCGVGDVPAYFFAAGSRVPCGVEENVKDVLSNGCVGGCQERFCSCLRGVGDDAMPGGYKVAFSSSGIEREETMDGDRLALLMQPSRACPSGFAYNSQCVCFEEDGNQEIPYLCEAKESKPPSSGSATLSPSSTPSGNGGGESSQSSSLPPEEGSISRGPSVSARLLPLFIYIVILGAIGGYMLKSMNRNKEENAVVVAITGAESGSHQP